MVIFMKFQKITSVALALALFACIPKVYAQERYATRGEVAQMLLTAADDYNSGVQKSDIMKGEEDGLLHEERSVTRAEALVMLRRAFGSLPAPAGHNARVALPAESFYDIPDWAQEELSDVFAAGIVAGTTEGAFSPDEPVTAEQMKLFTERVYALFGSNEKDDFYAAVNKEKLEKLTIRPGTAIAGTLYDLSGETASRVEELIEEITSATHEPGSREQKVSDFYQNILNMQARNAAGITPIKKYLDSIENVQTVSELAALQNVLIDEISIQPFMGFSLTVDLKDSTKYTLYFNVNSPALPKDCYADGNEMQAEAYLEYLEVLLALGGEEKAQAKENARHIFVFEKALADASLNREEYGDVDKVYNVFTMQQIQELFPAVDMGALLGVSGLKEEMRIGISDVGLVKALAEYFCDENLHALKSYAKYAVLMGWGGALNQEFIDASEQFNSKYLGTQGSYTPESRAAITVQTLMPDYLGELYAEKYFSEAAKQDVENMVRDIVAVYRKRLESNSWMSESTKKKAIAKLNAMNVKIGYPDKRKSYLDDVEIRSAVEGGSYFENALSIAKAQRAADTAQQGMPVDKTEWMMYPFTVNACYSVTSNDITFPAAILQAPLYDVNAPREENLGGIGYIIAHEITHAFDSNGAKFDENGNAHDWWEAQDYTAFQKLCEKTVAFYDGAEGVPGIPMNGRLTLSENIADQGAAACITEVVSGFESPDFQLLYRSMADCWASTASREYFRYAAQADVHSTEKLRVNKVLVNCAEFYRTFHITENDGMYVPPEERIKIW